MEGWGAYSFGFTSFVEVYSLTPPGLWGIHPSGLWGIDPPLLGGKEEGEGMFFLEYLSPK